MADSDENDRPVSEEPLSRTVTSALPLTHKSASPCRTNGFAFPVGAKRLTTVSLPPSRRSRKPPTSTLVQPPAPPRVIQWEEAHNSRPPLNPDMIKPGPQTYSPPTKPLYETNSPIITFGRRTWPEKEGGARTSWVKPWFHSPHIWLEKVDFRAENSWPSPAENTVLPTLGKRHPSRPQPPSYTFNQAQRALQTPNSVGAREPGSAASAKETGPAPNQYEPRTGRTASMARAPAFSQAGRTGGTQLWPTVETTPGPGRYNPKLRLSKPHRPGYSIRSMNDRIDYSLHPLGPFCAFG